MIRTTRRLLGALGAAAALVLLAGPAMAHEVRQVGSYKLAVGWEHEPTYVGTENAVQIFIHDSAGNPVDDLGNPTTLKVTVSYGHQTSDPLDLEPSYDDDTGLGTHGEWDAAIIPTSSGVYAFHLSGSIDGQAIDQTFTSADSTFDDVQSPNSIEFPQKTPTAQELALAQTQAQTKVADANDSVSTAKTLAVVALVVAVAAVLVALVLGLRSRRSSAGG